MLVAASPSCCQLSRQHLSRFLKGLYLTWVFAATIGRALACNDLPAKMYAANAQALDYNLLPRLDFGTPRLSIHKHNAVEPESHRFDTLDYLYAMAERRRVRWAA